MGDSSNQKPLINGVTLPTPPFVEIEGLPNLRDLGGYPVAGSENKSVRRGVVYRSAAPSLEITDAGFEEIRNLNIAKVYDLRSTTEIAKSEKAGKGGVVELPGTERVFAPVFLDHDYSPESLALRFSHYQTGTPEGFSKAYTDILNHARSSYSVILRHLASPSPKMLMHCTAGKDRTGVLCGLILALCGVQDEIIAKEYQLTEQGLAAWRVGAAEALKKSHKIDFNETTALNMLGATYGSMMMTLAMIRDKFGGVETYCKINLGLTDQEIEAVRKNMVVEEPASVEI